MRTDNERACEWLEANGHGTVEHCVARSGGDTCDSWELTLVSGARVFLKTHAAPPAEMFAAEAAGLTELRRSGTVRVPAVIHADPSFLLLEFIAPGVAGNACSRRLGHALARLHRIEAPCFGFLMDNWCGTTPQPNPRDTDGHAFFANHRLRFQAGRAHAAGLLGASDLRRVDAIAARLENLVPVQAPALLHGDLWHGNVFADTHGEAVLVDPAAYWGWPEADLAMTRLFGGFDEAFYDAYRELRPLEPGWEQRVPLYNLYHLLNHLNLFGSAWLPRVREVLDVYA
jgi:protein-ribulosamine 3-kinase